MTNDQKKYDLEERTAKFGEAAIRCCNSVTKDEVTRPIIYKKVRD